MMTPMQWPGAWKDPTALDLLKGTAIDYLLIDGGPELEPVRSRALMQGLKVGSLSAADSGIVIAKGVWPGVRMGNGGGNAGPTGVPWIDSNGWRVRLASTLHPGSAIWVNAPPKANARINGSSNLIAIADSAAYGGRWIISLDDKLAAAIAEKNPQALDTWAKTVAAADFFAHHQDWSGYVPEAVIGVVSSFTGKDAPFSTELLNLLDRAGTHTRIIPKSAVNASSFKNLLAVVFADAEPPAPDFRKEALGFIKSGGKMITPASSDPYEVANDAVVQVSHRYDLVRFWNGGATGSYYVTSPDRKRAVVHLLFYANRGPDSASVRIAGQYRTARIMTVDQPTAREVQSEIQRDAIEVHLPEVSQYVAVELA